MNVSTILTVGGTELPPTSDYSSTTVTMVDGARNSQGVFVGQVVRSDVINVEAKWNFLTPQQLSTIFSLFTSNFINSVKFLNTVTGQYDTRNFYVDDRKSGEMVAMGGNLIGYRNVSLKLIEV